MNIKKIVFQIIILCICTVSIYYVLKDQDLSSLKQLHWSDIMIYFVLRTCSYCFSGVQYYFTLRKMGCHFYKKEIFLFPLRQSFWGIVMPFQGSAAFVLYYLKTRYSFNIGNSITIVLFLYLFSVIFASIAGILYSVLYLGLSSPLFMVSLLFCLSPFGIKTAQIYYRKRERLPFVPKYLNDYLRTACNEMNKLFSNKKEIVLLVSCQIARHICLAFAFMLLAHAVGEKVSWLWGYLLAVFLDLSIILKFTPGNLGIAELFSGFVSAITGVGMATGVGLSLLNTTLSLILVIFLGGALNIPFICSKTIQSFQTSTNGPDNDL